MTTDDCNAHTALARGGLWRNWGTKWLDEWRSICRAATPEGVDALADMTIAAFAGAGSPVPPGSAGVRDLALATPGQVPAQRCNCSTCAALAFTRNRASTCSSPSSATAVWEPLCGSIPMITSVMPPPRCPVVDRGGHV
jgi:hypothetical protein